MKITGFFKRLFSSFINGFLKQFDITNSYLSLINHTHLFSALKSCLLCITAGIKNHYVSLKSSTKQKSRIKI